MAAGTDMPIPPLNRYLRVAEFSYFFLKSFIEKQGSIHDTISHGGWAGAVIWRAGAGGMPCTQQHQSHVIGQEQ